MTVLLALHAVAAVACTVFGRSLGRGVVLWAAIPPALAAGWAATLLPSVLDGEVVEERVAWVPALGLEHVVLLDQLSVTFVLLVGGVGAVVALYCGRYFSADEPGLPRFAGLFVAFAGAMLGLVLADDLRLLYVYWELTTILSFLLIAYHDEQPGSRGAALESLLVTTFGGLAMLGGFVLVGEAADTYRVSALVASPPAFDAQVVVGLVLVLLGAFTKSAQVPFHAWLPAAMAAPTPVSAYLHAAAMVKAGVYLLARLAPGFADAPGWRPLVVTVGLATMLLGGWRAMRQNDLKRLLAFGTVSQLGFLVLLAGLGTRTAAVAVLGVLVAHALSKAALFLAVGVVDHETGTRDLTELSGLGRAAPGLAVWTGLAALSYAAIPPFVGFVSKEAGFEAFYERAHAGHALDGLVLVGLVTASCLTVAYTLRFWWGAFGHSAGVAPVDVPHPPPRSFVAPTAVLAAGGVVAGLAPALVDALASAYAEVFPAGGAEPYHLALWHGLTPVLGMSVVTVVVGALLFARMSTVHRLQNATPTIGDAEGSYQRTLSVVDGVAVRVTAVVQSGSLPVYLATVLGTLLLVPGTVLLFRTDIGATPYVYDTPLQALVGALVAVATLFCALARRRFTAVLFLGAVGYGVAVLFVLQGAPDLALTQFLVETLSLVVFVFVLRRLPRTFSRQATRGTQVFRGVVAALVGVLVTAFALVATGARERPPIASGFVERAPETGGYNVVNLILVEFRAFDTLGEVTVLVVAAMGIAALVLAGRPRRAADTHSMTVPLDTEGQPMPRVDEGAAEARR